MISDLCRSYRNNQVILCDHLENEDFVMEEPNEFEERVRKFKLLLQEQIKIHNSILIISHHRFINCITGKNINNCQIINYELPPLCKIQFIRHAQSRFNAGINEFNSGITDYGKKQANLIKDDVDLVIVSTLKRTHETLENSDIK